MGPVKSYRNLLVWQRSMDLAVTVYRLIASLPQTEQYALRPQMRRSATSVPTNIAEGFGRGSPKEYSRFVGIARGSLMELETQLALAVRLELVSRDAVLPIWEQTTSVAKMLTALRKSLDRAAQPRTRIPKP